MFSNPFNYNKIIYLEIINNTIYDYKKIELNQRYYELSLNLISFNNFHSIYNKYLFDLYKSYNYYLSLPEYPQLNIIYK